MVTCAGQSSTTCATDRGRPRRSRRSAESADPEAVADVGPPRTHWAKEMGLLFAVALLIVWPVRTFVAQAYYIPSASMTPQLAVNDRVVVSKLAYDLHDPHRGDIVVFDAPPGLPALPDRSSALVRFIRRLFQPSTQEYIKRVVALPGETVEGRQGRILI